MEDGESRIEDRPHDPVSDQAQSPVQINGFRDLTAYREARQGARAILGLSRRFPRSEAYALTDQIRRSSRAVGALIAEAWGRRRYPASFASKLCEALAEANETQAWLDSALDAGYVSPEEHANADLDWQHVGGRIQQMIARRDSFCRAIGRAPRR